MSEIIEIVQGDSSDIYTFESADISVFDAEWSASWAVTSKLGESPLLTGDLDKNELIPASGNDPEVPAGSYFILQLSPADTEQLSPGTWYVTVQVKRTVSGTLVFRREVMQQKIKIKPQGVPA